MARKLLIASLLAAGLAAGGALAGAWEPGWRIGHVERNDQYTDTPLAPEDVRRKAVFDERRNQVGVVSDVVETARFGPVAIVEVKDVSGISPKKVAVTLDQLILEPDGRLVALLDKDDFRSLPEFTQPGARRS